MTSTLPSVRSTVTDALSSTLGVVGLSILFLLGWAVTCNVVNGAAEGLLQGPENEPLAELYVGYIRPMMSINLLNASHIYLIALIVTIVSIITVVDGALGYVNAAVATQARIPLRLVDALNAETGDLAIANAGRTSLPKK